MKIEVQRTRCMAIGNCAASAPSVFDQSDDDGTVLLLDPDPPATEHARVAEAAAQCPAAAILVRGNDV